MDWLQFFSSVVGSLAWPAAIVACVLIFRQKLAELMPMLSLKYMGFEASFRLDQAEKEAAELPLPPASPEAQPTPEEKDNFQKIAQLSPRAAILEVRTEIEDTLRNVATGIPVSNQINSTAGLTRLLRNRDVIDHQTSALLDDLRVIGNQAAHNSNAMFSVEDALRYKALADRVIAQLRSVKSGTTFE